MRVRCEKMQWGYVGKHRVGIDDDVFVCINDGSVSLPEMMAINDQIRDAAKTLRVRFVLLDLSHSEAPSPEARKYMSKNPYVGIEAVAGYGASRTLRVLSDLMRKAMALLGSAQGRAEFRLFTTEAEARLFLQSLRTKPLKP
ncbi:MAG TPA: hypothetical protein PKA58_36000 [Polyangium sp.]|nr:hypothetical protein [Polyangium sp.]